MKQLVWFTALGLLVGSSGACGPDAKPAQPCNGPNFDLVVRAEDGPLPPDVRINVRYGANQEGEPYELGQSTQPQAVDCSEDRRPDSSSTNSRDSSAEDAALGGAGGQGSGDQEVWALRCQLFTQGPASLDATAAGYEPISERPLSLDSKHRCEVEVEVTLVRERPKSDK